MFLFGPLARTFDMTALPWAWLHGLGEGGLVGEKQRGWVELEREASQPHFLTRLKK